MRSGRTIRPGTSRPRVALDKRYLIDVGRSCVLLRIGQEINALQVLETVSRCYQTRNVTRNLHRLPDIPLRRLGTAVAVLMTAVAVLYAIGEIRMGDVV